MVSLVMFNAECQFGGTLNHHGNTSPDIPLRVFLDQLFDEVRHVVDLATFQWLGSLTEKQQQAEHPHSFLRHLNTKEMCPEPSPLLL